LGGRGKLGPKENGRELWCKRGPGGKVLFPEQIFDSKGGAGLGKDHTTGKGKLSDWRKKRESTDVHPRICGGVRLLGGERHVEEEKNGKGSLEQGGKISARGPLGWSELGGGSVLETEVQAQNNQKGGG